MTVRIEKPSLNLREELAKGTDNTLDKAVWGDLTVNGNISSTGIDDNATATAVTVDASGDVGIGTDSPTFVNGGGLHVHNSAAGRIHVTGGSSGTADTDGLSLTHIDSFSYLWNYENGSTVFGVNNAERMRINSSGNVGIGTSSPSSYGVLTANGNIALGVPTRNQTDTKYIGIYTTDDPVSDSRARIGLHTVAGASSSDSYITFRTNKYGVSEDERMRIDSSGHLIVPNGITLGTAVGTYNAANTLDDYEEGTWTPAFIGGTTSGTGTYGSDRFGYYTKVGRQVTVHFRVSWSAHTGTGSLRISNLPFTISSVNGFNPFVGSVAVNNLTLPASTIDVVCTGNISTTQLIFLANVDSAGWTNIQMDTSVSAIAGTFTYFTA